MFMRLLITVVAIVVLGCKNFGTNDKGQFKKYLPQNINDTSKYFGLTQCKLIPSGNSRNYVDTIKIVRFHKDSICVYFKYMSFVNPMQIVDTSHKPLGEVNMSFDINGGFEYRDNSSSLGLDIQVRFLADSIFLDLEEKYSEVQLTNKLTFAGQKIGK